jgi:superfamily II DNA or RNA helicase
MEWHVADGAISLNLHRLTMNLRKWQEQAVLACVKRFETHKFFMIEACPGAGKSFCSSQVALRLLERNAIDLVVILSPSCGTRLTWRKTFESELLNGRRIGVTEGPVFPVDTEVWSSTYAGYDNVEKALHERPTSGIFAIIDEVHHAEESAEWGRAVDRLVSLSDYALFLSGTPWRREGRIAQLCTEENSHRRPYYGEDNRIAADYVYDYGQDLRNKVSRATVPVKFYFWDSFWQSSDGRKEEKLLKDLPSFPFANFETENDWYEWAKNCDTPLGKHLHFDPPAETPEVNKLLKNILDESLNLLYMSRRQAELSCRAKNLTVLLCVAKSIKEARAIADYIQDCNPSYKVAVVVSDDSNGAAKLERITKQCQENSPDKPDVIVSVGMVSEGVDIPQIKVIAFMSAILTTLYFIQVVGRALRRMMINKKENRYADTHLNDTIAYVVAPSHPRLRYIAKNIERQVQDAYTALAKSDGNASAQSQAQATNIDNGRVDSGQESSVVFRESEDFGHWHDIIEAMKIDDKADECHINSLWAEYVIGLLLSGKEGAKEHAIQQIEAQCQCLGKTIDEIKDVVTNEIETVLSYEEEQAKLKQRAVDLTNRLRFKMDKYKNIADNDLAFRKVRGDINRMAGLASAGVSFSRASLDQKKLWVKCAQELLSGIGQ